MCHSEGIHTAPRWGEASSPQPRSRMSRHEGGEVARSGLAGTDPVRNGPASAGGRLPPAPSPRALPAREGRGLLRARHPASGGVLNGSAVTFELRLVELRLSLLSSKLEKQSEANPLKDPVSRGWKKAGAAKAPCALPGPPVVVRGPWDARRRGKEIVTAALRQGAPGRWGGGGRWTMPCVSPDSAGVTPAFMSPSLSSSGTSRPSVCQVCCF